MASWLCLFLIFSIKRELDCVLALGSRARLVNRIIVGFKSKKNLLLGENEKFELCRNNSILNCEDATIEVTVVFCLYVCTKLVITLMEFLKHRIAIK